MIQLAVFNNPRMLQAFVDYLSLQGIKTQVKAVEGDQFALLVEPSGVDLAKVELEAFLQNPNDSKYLEASWHRGHDENPLSYSSSGNTAFKNIITAGGWLSNTVLLLNLLIFALAHFSPLYDYLAYPSAFWPQGGEYWRWFTPAFMHFSALHILFNLVWWQLLGGKLEKQFGSSFLLLFLLFTALISNFAQFISHQANNFGGLSGVVYALIGFCWLYGKQQPRQSVQLSDSLFGFAVIWLIMGYMDVLWMNVANQAHLSGLLCGLAFAWGFGRRQSN